MLRNENKIIRFSHLHTWLHMSLYPNVLKKQSNLEKVRGEEDLDLSKEFKSDELQNPQKLQISQSATSSRSANHGFYEIHADKIKRQDSIVPFPMSDRFEDSTRNSYS